MDESGFLLVPSVRRTWAPKGKTPTLRCAGNWTKISSISALGVSPKRKRIALYIRFHPNRNIRAAETIRFLQILLQHLTRGFFLLWDRSRVHRAILVQNFLEKHPKIHRYYFPAYAPELNPVEFVWNHLKRSTANGVPKDNQELRSLLHSPVQRLPRHKELLWSCIDASELPWQ